MGHYLRVIAPCALSIALVAVPGCEKTKNQSAPPQAQGQETARATLDGAGEPETFKGTKELPSSKNVVLGLRIPQGMDPMPAPKGVYRFEGVYPVPQVADYIKDAVLVDVITQAGHKTFEFRSAKVKAPVGRTEDPALLGIRVTEAVPHGSRLDIWMEKAAEAGAAGATYGRKGTAARGRIAPPAARLSKSETQKRSQRRTQTLDALIKTQKSKERLSDKERDLLH